MQCVFNKKVIEKVTAFPSGLLKLLEVELKLIFWRLAWISPCVTSEYTWKMGSLAWKLYYLNLWNWHQNLSESCEMLWCLSLHWKYLNIMSRLHYALQNVSEEYTVKWPDGPRNAKYMVHIILFYLIAWEDTVTWDAVCWWKKTMGWLNMASKWLHGEDLSMTNCHIIHYSLVVKAI